MSICSCFNIPKMNKNIETELVTCEGNNVYFNAKSMQDSRLTNQLFEYFSQTSNDNKSPPNIRIINLYLSNIRLELEKYHNIPLEQIKVKLWQKEVSDIYNTNNNRNYEFINVLTNEKAILSVMDNGKKIEEKANENNIQIEPIILEKFIVPTNYNKTVDGSFKKWLDAAWIVSDEQRSKNQIVMKIKKYQDFIERAGLKIKGMSPTLKLSLKDGLIDVEFQDYNTKKAFDMLYHRRN